MPAGSGEIPNFTVCERFKTPKTDCALKAEFTKTKNSISLDPRFVDLENSGLLATLNAYFLALVLEICVCAY